MGKRMKIEEHRITIRELVEDYDECSETNQVVAYGRKLDVRPPYQREYVYDPPERNAVIDTVSKGFPLNVMYWAVRDDGSYEVIDGQQRTISIARFVRGDFSVKGLFDHKEERGFRNLQKEEREKILDYELHIYRCTGTDSDRLTWFKLINIAGVSLTNQEMRNAVYHGPWLSEAKRWFSRTGGPAHVVGGAYLSGTPKRQEYLETAIKWISDGNIEKYMSDHQKDEDADPLWEYFQEVIGWVSATFPKKRSPMKQVDWHELYKDYKDEDLDLDRLEAEIKELLRLDTVKRPAGVYPYVLTGEERYLNIRAFKPAMKQAAFERQDGKCAICGKSKSYDDMQGDHIKPWIKNGPTTADNCQMLCRKCNLSKGAK